MPVSAGDLHIYQGADFSATVDVLNEDGTPADLTGCTARAQIRRDVADVDPEVAAELTTVIESPYIKLSLLRTETVNLCGRYVWDLDLDTPAGASIPIMAGKVLVTQEVTREVVMAARGAR